MSELRPHFSAEEFFAQVKKQMTTGDFRFVYLAADDVIEAVGLYRVGEWLAGDKYLEIEDLAAKATNARKAAAENYSTG